MISLPHITAISPNRSLLHSFNRPVYTRRHDQRKERTTMSSSSSSPTTAKRVVLVRHGQSTWNEEGRIQGSSDFSVLTTKGESQADISRQMLVEDSFDVCFTSPLKRSKKTAEIIWGSREAEMIFDYDLREIDLYSFQGLLKKEGKEKFGEAFGQWQEDPANFVIDGHYPVRELWSRARSCWNGVLAHESNSVLVVAHNAVNQALVSTAIGLGTEYFRRLLQSNCGVSVLDFIPRADGGSPIRAVQMQTPSSPLAGGSSGGRKASKQIILVCHGQSDNEASTNDQPMNMLGVIQSQKTAELLLDLRVASIVCSSSTASTETAGVISRVQEAAGCLGVDSVPRYDIQSGWLSQLDEETVSTLWNRSKKAWESLLDKLSDEDTGDAMVVVGSSVAHISLIAQCLNLDKKCLELFHLDAGSISVIDFPDGPSQRGVIRCTNYTAHLGRWSVPITRSV
ncbi:hypothetical protein YC2023_021738 [Brassica napus]